MSGWTWLQSNSAADVNGSSASVSYASNLASVSKLIAAVSISGSTRTASSVKDAAGNSMTQVGAVLLNGGGGGQVTLWAMDTPSGDAGTKPAITATYSGPCLSALLIQEVAGLAVGNTLAAMVDGTAGTNAGTGGSSTGSPAYASAAANEYKVSVYGDDGGPETWTVPAGLTADANSVNSDGNADVALGYGNSSGGTESASWALTGTAADWGTILVAFKLASAAPPPSRVLVTVPLLPYRVPLLVPPRVITGPAAGPVHISSADTGHGAGAAAQLHVALSGADSAHGAAGVPVIRPQAAGAADSGHGAAQGVIRVSAAATGHGAGAVSALHVTLTGADTGSGTASGSVSAGAVVLARVITAPPRPEPITWALPPLVIPVPAAAAGPASSGDGGTGRAGILPRITLQGAADSAHGSGQGVIHVSAAASGHGAGLGSPPGTHTITAADSGHGQGSGIFVVVAAAAGHGTGGAAQLHPRGADSARGTAAALNAWPSAGGRARGTAAALNAWPEAFAAGHGRAAVLPLHRAGAAAGAGAGAVQDIGIWTYLPPSWRAGGRLGWQVAARGPDGAEVVVLETARPSGAALALAARISRAREVRRITAGDSACGSGAVAVQPVAVSVWVIEAAQVSVQVEG